MPLGPLGVTAVLAALDWGAWEWAISTNHPTIGLIAGLLMAPIAVALAWSLVRVILAVVRLALRRAAPEPLLRRRAGVGTPTRRAPYDIEAEERRDRVAA